MISVTKFITLMLVFAVATFSADAFVNKGPMTRVSGPQTVISDQIASSTALAERRWNFNEGQAPWGLKKNAEIWNGRVAQMAFVWIFLQELISGKGVFKGIEEGNIFFIANAGLFGLCVAGLTGWLAIQGDDDYTKEA
mmetsp:Transcript_80245/g.232997  ORF Transcript_80245/g.232997 Transcript_80245/m.232997 type:complete len:138 (-) Transcript_80245:242-655(-)|eukprot:CAMPEP_0176001318 /NCGR_PEP_ID=MMETSP0120_2-20121206/60_1 /TAXON_ID=160619 /ORGANISM="Kryptoperidinium foliaceum, Strain CCMP 1326" /LENGTH=137 /DNA_ID=CAMNT_0017333853 /DNA_START=145 /DNA_END=558 /DNA_ORIENTATION=-